MPPSGFEVITATVLGDSKRVPFQLAASAISCANLHIVMHGRQSARRHPTVWVLRNGGQNIAGCQFGLIAKGFWRMRGKSPASSNRTRCRPIPNDQRIRAFMKRFERLARPDLYHGAQNHPCAGIFPQCGLLGVHASTRSDASRLPVRSLVLFPAIPRPLPRYTPRVQGTGPDEAIGKPKYGRSVFARSITPLAKGGSRLALRVLSRSVGRPSVFYRAGR